MKECVFLNKIMGIIAFQSEEKLSDRAKEIWDQQLLAFGRITNMKKTLAHSSLAFEAYMMWYPLKESIATVIGERAAILYAHAISSDTDCLICSTYFRKVIVEWGEDPENLTLNELELSLVEIARAYVKNPKLVPKNLLLGIKKQFGDKFLVELMAFSGIMVATNYFNDVLDIPLDEYLIQFKK